MVVYIGAALIGLAMLTLRPRRRLSTEERKQRKIERDAAKQPVRPVEHTLVAWGDTMGRMPRAATEEEISERHRRQRELVQRATELDYEARHAAPAEVSFAGLDAVRNDAAEQLRNLNVLAGYVAELDEIEDKLMFSFNTAIEESQRRFNANMAELHREFVCGPRE